MMRHDIYKSTKPFSSVLTYRDQSPEARKLFYSSANQKALMSDIFLFWDMIFVWLGARLSNFFEKPLNPTFILPHKNGDKIFSYCWYPPITHLQMLYF
jgi:hypothetical protein